MPRVGRMRHRLVLQAEESTTDQYGARTPEWSDVAEVAAERLPMPGIERIRADAPEAMRRERIRIRHRSDVDESKRFRSGGTEAAPQGILEILSVHDVDGRKLRLEIICAQTS